MVNEFLALFCLCAQFLISHKSVFISALKFSHFFFSNSLPHSSKGSERVAVVVIQQLGLDHDQNQAQKAGREVFLRVFFFIILLQVVC